MLRKMFPVFEFLHIRRVISLLAILPILLPAACLNCPGTALAESRTLAKPVRIDAGLMVGTAAGNGSIHVFKGIPYAAPPVRSLRWKPPQPTVPWSDIRDCTAFGPVCPQPEALAGLYKKDFKEVSEDCLYLNVWAPAGSMKEKVPVMVWIHGGANITGSGSVPLYDGEALAGQGVVLVTFNYRLGPFGFFAHPLLSGESGQGVSGNYGLLDQIAALQWVQRNIAAFGGDPSRVTVFGESAGGLDIGYLMASPLAGGLFHRAIAESGHAFGRMRYLRGAPSQGKAEDTAGETWQESMEEQGERIARELGCADSPDPLAAMRKLSMEKVMEVSKPTLGLGGESGNRFGPVVDGRVIPDDVATIFKQGKQNDVPLIVGTNANEGAIFMRNTRIRTVAEYRAALTALYGPFADRVFALFPVRQPADIRRAMSDSLGDLGFIAGARMFARAMHTVKSDAYLYHFTMKPWGPLGRVFGAFHGAEIPYVFGNLDRGRFSPGEEHRVLSRIMSAYWIQFAKTGNPNKDGLVPWPPYDAGKDRYLEFGQTVKVGQGLRKEACDLAEEIAAWHKARHR